MYYAFLVQLMCGGFECQVAVIDQWQSEHQHIVVENCLTAEETDKQASCLFSFESLDGEVSNGAL